MNFGVASLAAPHAASSRVSKYSFTTRLDLAGSILVPVQTGDRTLLVGIRRDQAGIDCKPFTADQPRHHAVFDHPLKDTTEQVAVAEPFIAGTTERRMIGILSSILRPQNQR
jgi:hypothetical protein